MRCFPLLGFLWMGDVCCRKVVLELFSHYMALDDEERMGLMDRVRWFYLRFLNRMSAKVGCRVFVVPRCAVYVIVSRTRRCGTENEWIPEIEVSCGRKCRVVLDTSRECREYIRRFVLYIFGLDMVSGMTIYTSMITRFCVETFDWNEMVGDWVCTVGEDDDCWIYLCPMISLRCLPLATNEEAIPPYFEGINLRGPRTAFSVDCNVRGYADVFKFDMFRLYESRTAGVVVDGKVTECWCFACYDVVRKVCLKLPLSDGECKKPVCNECRLAHGLPVRYPLYSAECVHQEIGLRFMGEREHDYCCPWYEPEEGRVDRSVLERLLVNSDWGGGHITGGENDGPGGGAFVKYDCMKCTSETLIDEYIRLNVSVSGGCWTCCHVSYVV